MMSFTSRWLFAIRHMNHISHSCSRTVSTTPVQHFLFKKTLKERDKISEAEEKTLTEKSEEFFIHKPSTAVASQLEKSQADIRNKEAFQDAISLYLERHGKYRRGHVEFIKSAMTKMKEYGVHQDLDVYKDLLNIFPKEVMIPKGFWQNEFFHYPKQQECGVELLATMEENGVTPDDEVGRTIIKIFGYENRVLARFQRMLYWMPKMRHRNPWPVPRFLPKDQRKLYSLAVRRMAPDPISVVRVHELSQSAERSNENRQFLVDCTSPQQRELLAWMTEQVKKKSNSAPNLTPSPQGQEGVARSSSDEEKLVLYVDGPYFMFIREQRLTYYTLTTENNQSRRAAQQALDQRLEKMIDAARAEEVNSELYRFPSYFGEDEEETCARSPGPYEHWAKEFHTFEHLTGDANIHEQEEHTVLAMCMTPLGESALRKWPQLLREVADFPMDEATIVFRLKKGQSSELTTVDHQQSNEVTVPEFSCPM